MMGLKRRRKSGEKGKKKGKGQRVRELEASYTVEAALVMSIALFFIAALLNGIFQVHGRIAGRFVLQEALERRNFLEDSAEEELGITEETLLQGEIKRLRGFFRCGEGELTMERSGDRLKGRVNVGTETEIVVKEYDPEEKLRFLTAFKGESRGEESEYSLQKGYESQLHDYGSAGAGR